MIGLFVIIIAEAIAWALGGWYAAAAAFIWICVIGIIAGVLGWFNAGNKPTHIKHDHDVSVHIDDGISDPTYPDEHPIISAKVMKRKFKSLGRKGK